MLYSPVLSSLQADMLQDVAENLFLEKDGGIRHARCPYVPPTAQFSSRLNHLSAEVKQRYLVLQCRSFLYGFYFLQSDWWALPILNEAVAEPNGAAAQGEESSSTLANNLYKGLDTHFYDALVRGNCGSGYFDPGWQVLRRERASAHASHAGSEAECLSVQKHGLTLEINRKEHLSAKDCRAIAGDLVAVQLPPERTEAERYIAIGNRGLPDRKQVRLQIFFNLQPQGAASLVALATQTLNELNLPFQLEVLNRPDLYEQRCDGAVLEIHRYDYSLLNDAILKWARTLPLLPDILPMTQPLARRGISVAELLQAQSSAVTAWQQSERYGLRRCEAIAQGVVAAQQQRIASPAERRRCITAALQRWGVHGQLPYLNQGSEAIFP